MKRLLIIIVFLSLLIMSASSQYKVISYNVGIWTRNLEHDDLYWKTRMESASELIKDADILCLQELWFPANKKLCKDFKKVRGTGLEHPIYVRKGIETKNPHFRLRWSAVEIGGVLFITQHNHWNDKIFRKTWKQIDDYVSKKNLPAIICGDWNKTNVEVESIIDTTKYYFCANLYGKQNELTYEHFWDKTNTKTIDYFVSTNHYDIDYDVLPWGTDSCAKCSDHRPITLTIKINNE